MGNVLATLIGLWLAFAGGQGALHSGMHGPEVRAVQSALTAEGFSTRGVDGIYGPETAHAVAEFERSKGLVVDGLAGPQVVSRLADPLIGKDLLAEGSHGRAVKLAQQVLSQLGDYQGALDGIFGPKTQSAVKRFQASLALKTDGVVGPHTWAALLDKTVVVQAGQTLADIAAQQGVSAVALAEANHVKDPRLLSVGQRLVIPSASSSNSNNASGQPVSKTKRKQATSGSSSASKSPRWGGAGTPRVALAFLGTPNAQEGNTLQAAGVPLTVFFTAAPQNALGGKIDSEVGYTSSSEMRQVLSGLQGLGTSPKLAYVATPDAKALADALSAKLLPLVHATTAVTDAAAVQAVSGGELVVMPMTTSNVSDISASVKKLQAQGYQMVSAQTLFGQ